MHVKKPAKNGCAIMRMCVSQPFYLMLKMPEMHLKKACCVTEMRVRHAGAKKKAWTAARRRQPAYEFKIS
jgi:hypothetical protein